VKCRRSAPTDGPRTEADIAAMTDRTNTGAAGRLCGVSGGGIRCLGRGAGPDTGGLFSTVLGLSSKGTVSMIAAAPGPRAGALGGHKATLGGLSSVIVIWSKGHVESYAAHGGWVYVARPGCLTGVALGFRKRKIAVRLDTGWRWGGDQ
jgi:hypothetical protein